MSLNGGTMSLRCTTCMENTSVGRSSQAIAAYRIAGRHEKARAFSEKVRICSLCNLVLFNDIDTFQLRLQLCNRLLARDDQMPASYGGNNNNEGSTQGERSRSPHGTSVHSLSTAMGSNDATSTVPQSTMDNSELVLGSGSYSCTYCGGDRACCSCKPTPPECSPASVGSNLEPTLKCTPRWDAKLRRFRGADGRLCPRPTYL